MPTDKKPKMIVMKLMFAIALSLTLLVSVSGNEVYYDINESDKGYEMESTVLLECEEQNRGCPTRSWAFSWSIPENSEIQSIEDSYGEIEEYELSNDVVHIESNIGDRSTNETIRINLAIDEDRESVHESLEERKINLPSYEDSRTTGKIHSDNLISSSITRDFDKEILEDEIIFEGQGPTEVLLNTGEGEKEYIFSFFGQLPDNSINASKIAFETALGVTNREPNQDYLPVALMRPVTYDQEVGRWSAGQFSNNRIKIRNDLEERLGSVLAHETVHAINHDVMEWDHTESAYLDEGLATYAEFLADKRLYHQEQTHRKPAQLFGEDVSYTEREGDELVRFEVSSRGEANELWDYYQQDKDFMKEWYPRKAENREFGYAYSQLIIRNFIVEGGDLNELYEDLENVENVEDHDSKWSELEEIIDLEPCDLESRSEFDDCLNEINGYEYEVLAASSAESSQDKLEVEEVDLPEREQDSEIMNDKILFEIVMTLEQLAIEIKNIFVELKTEIKSLIDQAR